MPDKDGRMTDGDTIEPNTIMVNVADLTNPESGKTYREENMEKKHSFLIDALVEIKETGVRLYIAALRRDCDGTPLYSLAIDKSNKRISECFNGFVEDSFTAVTQKLDPNPIDEFKTQNGLWAEYPDYPHKDWRYEVVNGNTILGYWKWVEHAIESEVDDNEV